MEKLKRLWDDEVFWGKARIYVLVLFVVVQILKKY